MKSAAYHSQETGADREAASFNLALFAEKAVVVRCRIESVDGLSLESSLEGWG